MRPSELAKCINRHPNTVRRWISAGLIPVTRPRNRIVVVDLEEVKAAMVKNGLEAGKVKQ